MKKGQKKHNYSEIEQLEMCDLYVNHNKSMQQIADIYSRSEFFISVILDKHNIKRRKITRSTFDTTYFENINSKDKAYFLGLAISDGCNYGKGFTISVQDEDDKVIKLFKEHIKFSGKLNYRKLKNPNYKGTVRLKIHSNTISEQLSKFNVVPNKSLNCYFPDIPEEFYSHFIRGVFDGDGSICIYFHQGRKNSNFSILGHQPLIEKIQEIIIKECNVNFTKLNHNKLNHEKTLSVRYTGYKRLSKIFDWMYKDCDDLFIDRKFLKFKKIKDERI